MKLRTFSVSIAISAEWIARTPEGELETSVQDQLEVGSDEARGPRGGRYVAAGPISEVRAYQTHDDWMRNTTTYVIERPMRYVRPAP